MPKKYLSVFASFFLVVSSLFGQERRHSGKFEQLGTVLRSPNDYRTASGAPGPKYWQNLANYDIEVTLNDEKQSISGKETITYINNSPDVLTYLWVQLDQNQQARESHTYSTEMNQIQHEIIPNRMGSILRPDFDGGFKISFVTDAQDKPLKYTIVQTMMRVDMPKPMQPGDTYQFKIGWSYNINDRMVMGGRSGYEYFPEDKNYLYTIAQFFPRMCVYSDYGGWQNKQFLGAGEYTLPFGKYHVKITVPSDHMLGATGDLMNPEEVLTKKQIELLKKAETATEPVIILTQKEAEKIERGRAKGTKTWIFEADSVRDFAFATSRKFIWDAMGVKIGNRTVMAMSYYPKEGNPLWEQYSTRAVAQTLKTYSRVTFDYPYPKAISVHADRIGMEYPMICFNFGRPNKDGTYDDRTKYSMISVIIHEVGHNFFPMIVNSDERQWTWMDEGLNTFVQYLTEKDWDPDYPSRRGPARYITDYMRLDRSLLSPIMTNSEQVQDLGSNAYAKPATGLNILRETIMGPELFDMAFKEYAQRWMFKHPTPEDFFRTMEDASGIDLDWFWSGWFYTVDPCDIALTQLRKFKVKDGKAEGEAQVAAGAESPDDEFNLFYTSLNDEQKKQAKEKPFFYELTLENKGGLVMPVILEFVYKDGSTEIIRIPAEIWRKNDQKVVKVFPISKEVVNVILDPFQETADIDLENNYWPRKELPSRFKLYQEAGKSGR